MKPTFFRSGTALRKWLQQHGATRLRRARTLIELSGKGELIPQFTRR
jgi:hypothetical protein